MTGAGAASRGDARDALFGRRVVHLAGRSDARLVEHLAALTGSLHARGVPQTVVLLDDARRPLAARFDADVRLVRVEGPRWRAPRALWLALQTEVRRERVAAVHAHGLLPCLLGIFAARFLGMGAPLHVSPRAGRSDAEVGEAFFGALRSESRRPLVVASCRVPDAPRAARFAQLAVLLQSTGIDFHWLGPGDEATLAQLAAAGVDRIEPHGDAERAARLGPAWVYVEAGGTARPADLAEAMAVGLPCVAWNTAASRALLEHDRTGLLCGSEDALLAALARLVDSAELRARLGAAARAQAVARFSRLVRSEQLLAAYRAAAADLPLASLER